MQLRGLARVVACVLVISVAGVLLGGCGGQDAAMPPEQVEVTSMPGPDVGMASTPTGSSVATPALTMADGVTAVDSPTVGDPDGNGQVDSFTAIAILRFVVGMDPQPADITNWDADGNGTLSVSDAIQVLRWIVGLDEWTPGGQDTGSVTGIVRDAGTQQPIAGAVAQIGTQWLAMTGADGRFTIANVPVGNQTLSVSKDGYTADETDIAVAPGTNDVGNVDLVAATGSVTGIVRDAATQQPIAGAVAQIGTQWLALTGADGRFTIAAVPVGDQTLRVSKDGYTPNNTDIDVAPGTNDVGNVNLVGATGSVIGIVRDAATQQPIAGALARIGTQLLALTGADGRFTIANVPVGLQVVSVSKDGYTPRDINVAVVAGQNDIGNVDLVAGSGGDVEVTIIGVPGGSVSMDPGEHRQFTALVTGTTNSSVSWVVVEGNAGGTVDAAGNYTAPIAKGIFHVTAVSNADPHATDTVEINVEGAEVIVIIE